MRYMRFIPRPISLLASVFFLLSTVSCMVGPNFQKPGNDLPKTWASNLPPHSGMNDLREWWNIFGDSQLVSLVNKAVADNPDMKIALMRVREARSSVKMEQSTLLPSAGTSLGGARSGGFKDSASANFNHSLSASWELDVFGGNRRAIEAAEASLLSTEANAIAVRTALMAEVATTYFTWIANCDQLQVARDQLELQKKTLRIVQARNNVGFAADLDLQQALAQVAGTEGNIPTIEANMKSSTNTLSILLGSYMSKVSLKIPSNKVAGTMPEIPVGLPSDLLRRRPDIIGAEADLHAAVADIGVAIADMYPKFSLTGGLSMGSRKFFDMYDSKAGAWNLGGSMSQALYQGGALRERVKITRSAAERYSENYRKTLITAVGDVEQALINYTSYRKRLLSLEKQNAANRKAAQYALDLYTREMTDFLNVVSAQQSLMASEEAIVTMKQNIRKSVVQLALALGGGW